MSTNLRYRVLQACDAYLSVTTPHSHGFCSWAARYLGHTPMNDAVYTLIGKCRAEMVGISHHYDLPAYIGNDVGRTPARIQFVQDLRDYLLLDI